MRLGLKKSTKQMKLADFISQTIAEIVDGVINSQKNAKKGVIINPKHVNWSDTKQAFHIVPGATGDDQAPLLTELEFEILLTISSTHEGEAEIGVLPTALGLGITGKARKYSEAANRVRFKILAKLPQQADPAEEKSEEGA